MEEGSKRVCVRSRGILDLAQRIPQRDVRKLIWAYLNPCDREMVRRAHNPHRQTSTWDYAHVANWCVRYGYVALLDWFYEQNNRVFPWKDATWVVGKAADSGSVPMLEWIKARYALWPLPSWVSNYVGVYQNKHKMAMRFAGGARDCDYVRVLYWLRIDGIKVKISSQWGAIRGNFTEALCVLLDEHHDGGVDAGVVSEAIRLEHVAALTIIHRRMPLNLHSIRRHAAGLHRVLAWLDIMQRL